MKDTYMFEFKNFGNPDFTGVNLEKTDPYVKGF